MWGGRFAEGPAAIMREINASIPFDKALWRQDVAASKAHVAMLGAQGIVSAEDAALIAAFLVLPIMAGPEIGVASTKAFTCQLTTLALLGA